MDSRRFMFYKAFDAEGKPMDFPDFVELQWTRRFSAPGEFSLYIPAREYDPRIKYICKNVGWEYGIIQKTQFEQKPEGDMVTLSGLFYENLLNYGVFTDTRSFNYTTAERASDEVYQSLRSYLAALPGVPELWKPMSADPPNFGISSGVAYMGDRVGDFLYKMAADCGTRLRFWPYSRFGHIFPYQGNIEYQPTRDLSNKVYFGKSWGNVRKITYTLDETANLARITAYQDVGEATGISGTVQKTTAEGRKTYISETVTVDANIPADMNEIPTGIIFTSIAEPQLSASTEIQVRELMRTEARLSILNHYRIETIDVDVMQNSFYYGEDYDLGDVCTVVIDELKQMYKARIVEIREVHAKNQVAIQLTLGTPQKVNYRKVVI